MQEVSQTCEDSIFPKGCSVWDGGPDRKEIYVVKDPTVCIMQCTEAQLIKFPELIVSYFRCQKVFTSDVKKDV